MENVSRRRRIRLLAGGLAAALLIVFATNAGRLLIVDAPEKADLILVLAGETDHRPERGLQLLRQGYGRTLVLDVPATAEVYGSSEQQLAEKYARSLPEAASVRVCPVFGLSTKEESHDAETCIDREGGSRVLIVTSEFHTRRARSIFRHEIRGKSFSVAASYDGAQFGPRWWQHRQWAKTLVDEWLRLFWWNAVDRWR